MLELKVCKRGRALTRWLTAALKVVRSSLAYWERVDTCSLYLLMISSMAFWCSSSACFNSSFSRCRVLICLFSYWMPLISWRLLLFSWGRGLLFSFIPSTSSLYYNTTQQSADSQEMLPHLKYKNNLDVLWQNLMLI